MDGFIIYVQRFGLTVDGSGIRYKGAVCRVYFYSVLFMHI